MFVGEVGHSMLVLLPFEWCIKPYRKKIIGEIDRHSEVIRLLYRFVCAEFDIPWLSSTAFAAKSTSQSRASVMKVRSYFVITTRASRAPTSAYAHDSFVWMWTNNSTRGQGNESIRWRTAAGYIYLKIAHIMYAGDNSLVYKIHTKFTHNRVHFDGNFVWICRNSHK